MIDDAAIDDASDVQKAEQARANEELVGRRNNDALEFVMSDSRGRRFVHNLLTDCKVFGSCLSADPHTAYYKIGQQDIGHKLFAKVTNHQDGESYLKMMQEAAAERAELALTEDERRKDA